MSNIFTQDPLILDTVWTSGSVPAGLLTAYNQTFRRIVWVNPSTAGHECKITDAAGKVILDEFCVVAHQDVVLWDAGTTRKSLLLKQNLWILATLGSGALYMYR